jgi:predicted ATPase
MIRLIEAKNYRCLKDLRQSLGPFHVLVGPNASGKSSFMDVMAFLNRLVTDGVDAAVAKRGDIHDLFWDRKGNRFEIAIEAVVPEDRRKPVTAHRGDRTSCVRYEVAIGVDDSGESKILDEQVLLLPEHGDTPEMIRESFSPRESSPWMRIVVPKSNGAEPFLFPEMWNPADQGGHAYAIVYRATGKKSIFGNLSEAEFPTPIWLESVLRNHVTRVNLDPHVLQTPSRPGQGMVFVGNGSNFPWLVEELERRDPTLYKEWLDHMRTALPDVKGLRVVERAEDRHRYVMVRYSGGLELPSWSLSEGTLCLLALTFLAYWSQPDSIYLIEEPESHIHPLNIEVAMQSLSSVYGGQVLIATHSPAILAMTDVDKVLAFSRDDALGTRVIPGNEHPRLRDWKGEVSLGTLFASGVLG